MRSCCVGIGGCGGNLLQVILDPVDIIKPLSKLTNAEHVAFGGIEGVWLEADVNAAVNKQSFFKNEGYPGYVIPHDSIKVGSQTHSLVMRKYGYDIKKQGFFREAQYLKAIFEIFDNDEEVKSVAREEFGKENPILENAWNAIKGFTTLSGGRCDNILFMVSLGGGTGTGFINPILRYIRSGGTQDYPVFVLGVLTEQGDEADREQQSKEARRDLGATISMYDLLTKSARDGVDALILVDNQILVERFKQDYTSINNYIFHAMKPFLADRAFPQEDPPSLALAQNFTEGLNRPPVMVPCYASLNSRKPVEGDLVEKALTGSVKDDGCGPLFPCDPAMADRAFVFSRGYLSAEKLESSVKSITGLDTNHIFAWRKLGENRKTEVLILLRNPYGSGCGPFERRMYRVVSFALKYIEENRPELLHMVHANDDQSLTSLTTDALTNYFERLEAALENAKMRLKKGEKPLFLQELRIFDNLSNNRPSQDNNIKNNLDISEEHIRRIVREELSKYLPKVTG
ncbi:MAG: hypothetical protein NQU42_05250 [Methanothrix sp.]|uniref:hypothetical protein n=1 Tax=Methanothrix sp. TaxID=90426 RepID=UPI0025D2A970|nr:hypothetical protein [Methanothrix sp.]MCQ8903479.1 hypothetical protein [Methanothrix sp.]